MDSATQATPSELTGSSGITEQPIGRRRSDRIAGSSAAIQSAVEQASLAARTDRPVLVSGPEGSGRLHLAHAIHAWSSRASGPTVVLRASSTPQALHTREIFGTSAGGDPLLGGGSEGLLASAGGGTAIIADAERLSASARDALIQSLKNGSYEPDGAGESQSLEARLIVTSGSGDPSLLGDVSAHHVALSALSERKEDIIALAVHFLSLFAEEEGVRPVGFTADARRCLLEETWTGNVRELRERIRQAMRLAGNGAISVEALALATDGDDVPSFKEAKRRFETRYVQALLRRCGGNISRAARLARKDRKDFYDVIRRTGVDPQDFRR